MSARIVMSGLLGLGGLLASASSGCGGIVDRTAEEQFHQALGDTSVTVFPAFVREGTQNRYDANAAKTIGDFLTREKLATVTVSQAEVPVTSKWGANQAKMFRGSAADFSAYVRSHPPGTEYALLPEYLIGGTGTVMGVHSYLVDAEGTVAYAVLLNSHHDAFNAVDPKTVDDCTTILINVMRGEFPAKVNAKAAAGSTAP